MAAKVDTFFRVFSDPHFGQGIELHPMEHNSSNSTWQSEHLNSYIGIATPVKKV
jgi:hypothetical protein